MEMGENRLEKPQNFEFKARERQATGGGTGINHRCSGADLRIVPIRPWLVFTEFFFRSLLLYFAVKSALVSGYPSQAAEEPCRPFLFVSSAKNVNTQQ